MWPYYIHHKPEHTVLSVFSDFIPFFQQAEYCQLCELIRSQTLISSKIPKTGFPILSLAKKRSRPVEEGTLMTCATDDHCHGQEHWMIMIRIFGVMQTVRGGRRCAALISHMDQSPRADQISHFTHGNDMILMIPTPIYCDDQIQCLIRLYQQIP